jgi:hypothetical protein
MSVITVVVPFIYELSIIKPRCRKPVTLLMRDIVEVEINQRTPNDMPVAIVCKHFDKEQPVNLHWDGQSLFVPLTTKNKSGEASSVTVEQFVENASTGQGEVHSTASPFYRFWSRSSAYASSLYYASLSDDVADGKYATLGDLKGRHLSDNRDQMIERAKAIAASYVVVDGLMMGSAAEPNYHCITFGLGMNHSSTALMDGHYDPRVAPERFYFNLLQLQEAIEYTTQVAINRGDTKSLPIKPHTDFTVLIPAAIRMPANVDYLEKLNA